MLMGRRGKVFLTEMGGGRRIPVWKLLRPESMSLQQEPRWLVQFPVQAETKGGLAGEGEAAA